jgi:hypothetical protein
MGFTNLHFIDTLEDENVEKQEDQEWKDPINYKVGPHDVSKNIGVVHPKERRKKIKMIMIIKNQTSRE